MREHADPWRDDGGEFLPGHDGNHAGHALGGGCVDAKDFRMRMRRAQEHDMRHPWQFDVADVEPAALQQPFEIGPRHGLADIGVRPVQHRKRIGIAAFRRHGARPIRARAVLSTASMMA